MALKPHGIRTSYLNISSEMDPLWESSNHNPANFNIQMPNSLRTNKIWKIVPNIVTVPRMFPNIPAPDNVLIWYQRQVVEIPTATPDYYLRTVSPNWTATRTITFEEDIWNIDRVLAKINAQTGPDEVWSFDPVTLALVITVTPSSPPIVFGEFYDPGHVDPPLSYMGMAYLAEGAGGHLFTILGLEKQASLGTALPLSPAFIPASPPTFDNIINSNIDGRNLYPLFDRTLHSYDLWATTQFISPLNNQPNLAGPTTVHVIVSDLGDSSAVDAKTGTLQDIVSTLNLGDVSFGTYKSREVNDVDGECVEYQQARNISQFNVRLIDTRGRNLRLPRNFPVCMKLQLTHIVG